MKTERHVRIGAWRVLLGVSLIIGGCAGQTRQAGDPAGMMKKAPGYTYVMGAMTSRGFDTPPYIPGKIRFELEIHLREKGLLAPPSPSDERLTLNVESEAIYSLAVVQPSRIPSESYRELISTVRVTDARTGDAVAEATFRSYNGFGGATSDFTEKEHARDIALFLEAIVR